MLQREFGGGGGGQKLKSYCVINFQNFMLALLFFLTSKKSSVFSLSEGIDFVGWQNISWHVTDVDVACIVGEECWVWPTGNS